MVAAATIGSAVAGPLIGGMFGSDASSSAGNTQAQASTDAANIQAQSQRDATAAQQAMYQQTRGDLSPYMQNGNVALNSLMGKMGNGELGGKFSPTDYLANQDPGYGFQLNQGNQALQNSQAAHDGVMSGSAMKGLIDYNQGMASTGYQNAYNRWLDSQKNTFGQLSGVATMGGNAAAGAGNIGAQYGQGISGTITGAGNAMGAGIRGAGNANASGIMGSANALSDAFGKAGGIYNGYSLSGMLNGNQGGYGPLQGGYQDNMQGATGDFARMDRASYQSE